MKNYKSVILAFMVALFLISLLACRRSLSGNGGGEITKSPSGQISEYSNPGFSIEASVGEEFTITLASNRTTGYCWQLSEKLDENILKLVGSKYIAPETKLVGAGGKEIWKFKAVGQGKTTVSFKYVRRWEKGVPPAREQAFLVIVR